MAKTHINNFNTVNQVSSDTKNYYEFGAGWDLINPIFMGLNNFNVFTIDIRKLIFPELILHAIESFNLYGNQLPFELGKKLPPPPPPPRSKNSILEYLKENCNVSYSAPHDARDTKIETESIDFISSTATFEHISLTDLRQILKECYRILKKGGIISIKIDYRDHWAFFDKTLTY